MPHDMAYVDARDHATTVALSDCVCAQSVLSCVARLTTVELGSHVRQAAGVGAAPGELAASGRPPARTLCGRAGRRSSLIALPAVEARDRARVRVWARVRQNTEQHM